MAFTPMVPTYFILQQLLLLTDPREELPNHLGVCMSRAYGNSGFPRAVFMQHLFSSKITIQYSLYAHGGNQWKDCGA